MQIGTDFTTNGGVLERLGRALRQGRSIVGSPATSDDHQPAPVRHASVAMVLRPRTAEAHGASFGGVEIALIERASRPGDPWSGQIAMPGGRADPSDHDLVHTAIRETEEEVGLVLDRSDCLGTLGAHRAHTRVPAMAISGFVFGVSPEAELGPVEPGEVASASWVPIGHLLDPSAAVRYRFTSSMDPFPGVLLPDGSNVLWGLTYRFVDTMLGHLGERLPNPAGHSPVIEHHGPRGTTR